MRFFFGSLLLPILLGAGILPDFEVEALEGAELSDDLRFARIDSLSSLFVELEGRERAACAHRLAQLYLSTDLMKHRRRALEYLDQAIELDPTLFDAGRLRAATAESMHYQRDARQSFERLRDRNPEDPRPYALLGGLQLRESVMRLKTSGLEKARDAYARSIQLDPEFERGWLGLARSCLALEQWEATLSSSKRLHESAEWRRVGLFLSGAAYTALGDRRLARECFEEALALSDESLRDLFYGAHGFLDEHNLAGNLRTGVDPARIREVMRLHRPDWEWIDDVDAGLLLREDDIYAAAVRSFWRERNVWPTHEINSRQLLFWRRLVEADMLFGSDGVHGWETAPGEALARWGRPDFTIYEPATTAVDLGYWYYRGVRLNRAEDVPQHEQLWVWTYRRDGSWFSLLFTDPTMRTRWIASGATAAEMLGRARRNGMLFFDGEREPRFDFALTHSCYPRQDFTHLESTIAVYAAAGWVPTHRLDPDVAVEQARSSYLTVEWAIHDAAGRQIEYLRRELDERYLRSRLRSVIEGETARGGPPGRSDALLCRVSAALEPGIYDVSVDLSSPTLGHRSRQEQVVVPEMDPPGFLALSPLQLMESFASYEPGMQLQPDFVRYAYGMLPSPGRRFPAQSDQMFVYYECYNLATDAQGLTRFDVSYEIYKRPDKTALRQEGVVGVPSGLEGLTPRGLSFLHERTGLSPDGHVVKGGNVDIGALRAGEYVLIVRIEDLHSQQSASRYISFSKS
jgi:GWxTD domain-containing protein